jgi:gliding motility-associated-like protein
MKKGLHFSLLFLLSFLFVQTSQAAHIVGADLTYVCLNPATSLYQVRLRVFRDCAGGGAQFDDPLTVFIFRGSNGQLADTLRMFLPTTQPQIVPPNWSACTTQPYTLCVEYADYVGTTVLAPRIGGYDIGWARCCRNNIVTNVPNNQGMTVTAHVPGTDEATGCNSSPTFNNLAPQFLCANQVFNFDHSATDVDGDSLVYTICPPFSGTNTNNQGANRFRPTVFLGGFGGGNPMGAPPYNNLNYQFPYGYLNPFGNMMFSIDRFSGRLTLTPANLGTFVFAICVSEYRNGTLISTNKRDFQITVINCVNQGQPPTASSNLGGVPGATNDTIYTYPGDTVCYDISLQGAVATDTVALFPASAIFGVGGSLPAPLASITFNGSNPAADSVSGQVCWPVTCPYAGDTLLFVVGGNNLSDCFGLNQAYDTVTVIVTGASPPVLNRPAFGRTITVNPNANFNYGINALDTDLRDSLLIFTLGGFLDSVNVPTFTFSQPTPQSMTGRVFFSPGCDRAGQSIDLIIGVQDTNACQIQTAVYDTLTVNVRALPSFTAGPTGPVICRNDSIQLFATAGAVGNFSWSPGTSLDDSTLANPFAFPDSTTTYTVTYTDANGCVQSQSLTVNVNPLPVVTVTPDTFYCPGIPVGLQATGGVSYTWTPALGLSDSSLANPLASPDDTTRYTVLVTDANGCQQRDSVLVTTMEISTSVVQDTLCFGDSTQLTATGGVSYLWSPAASLSNPSLASPVAGPGTPTDFIVTITDNNGCVDRDTVPVWVNPLPVITMSPDTAMCIFDTIGIRASGGLLYQWDPDPSLLSNAIPNPQINPVTTTRYRVTVIDTNGCVNRDSVLVTVNPLPVIVANNDTAKCGNQGVPIGATGGVNYQWFPALGLNDPFSQNPIANPDSSTTYYVIGIDGNQCANVDSIQVRVMYANAGPDEAICIGDTTQLSASGGVSYSWAAEPDLIGTTSANPLVFPQATKDYVVTVTDTTGCTDDDTVRITVNPLPVTSVSNPDPYVCTAGATQLTATGGTTYIWQPDTTLSALNIANPIARPLNLTGNLVDSTWYYVTVIDSNGCVNQDSIGLEVRIRPIVSTSNDTFACPGQSVPLTASGGISYSWIPAATLDDTTLQMPTASPLVTTRYTATVTAVWGCFDTASVLVDVINPDAGADTTICLLDSAQLLARGGVTYRWSPATGLSDTTLANPKASPAATTTYIVTVTDSNGCTDVDTMTVFVNPLPPADAGMDDVICIFDTTTLTASGGISYRWDASLSLSSDSTAQTQAFPTDTTTFYVTVTDANTCSARDSVQVIVNLLPPADAGSDLTKCGEPGVQLNATGGVIYNWFPTDSLSNPGIANPIATPLDTTTYYVLVTDTNGCRNIDSVTVSTMYAAASGGAVICFADSIQLTASGGIGYSWSPAASLSYPLRDTTQAAPDTSTRFVVTVLDPSGCTDTASTFVTVLPAPPADAGPDTAVCDGLSVTLQASGGVSYLWDADTTLSALNIPNPVASPVDTTVYYLTVTGANGCTWRDSVQVDIHPLPTADAGTSVEICFGDTTQLDALASTGASPLSYAWDNGASLDDPSSPGPLAFPQATTTYGLVVTDRFGCIDDDSVTITVNPLPPADAGSDVTICVFDSTQLQASGGVSYLWDAEPSLSSLLIADPVAGPQDTTTYFVTVTDDKGCSARDSVTVTVNLLPPAEAGEDAVICLGQSTQLLASGGIIYQWAPEDGSLSNAGIFDPVAQPDVSTRYYVTVTDTNSCVNVDSVLVTVNPLPEVVVSPDTTICEGFAASLRATGALNYLWAPGITLNNPILANPLASPVVETEYIVVGTDGNGCQNRDSVVVSVIPKPDIAGSPGDTICKFQFASLQVEGGVRNLWSTGSTQPIISIDPHTTTTYWAVVYDVNNCPSDTLYRTIVVEENLPRARFETSPEEGFVALEVAFNNLSQGATRFFWDFGDGQTSDEPSPLHTYLQPGQYQPKLVVDNEIGCPDSTQVQVVEVWEEEIYFPNAFSPNNDGKNDAFFLPNGGFRQLDIRIFNRWGQLMFESSDPNFRWDGTFQGQAVPEGVYIYQVIGYTYLDQRIERSGSITLIR